MQVHYDEGIATHIGPKPCVVPREGAGEASAGERTGQPLSREILDVPGADAFLLRKATQTGALMQAPEWPGVVEDPGMCGRSLNGNREISRPARTGTPALARIGKVRSRSR